MIKALEDAIFKAYTFKTVYPWRMECRGITADPLSDTEMAEAYNIEVAKINNDETSSTYSAMFFLPRLIRGSVKVKGRPKQSIYTALGNYKVRCGREYFSWGNGYSGTQILDVAWGREDHVNLMGPYDMAIGGNPMIVSCHFSNLIKYFGLWEDRFAVYFQGEESEVAKHVEGEEFSENIPKFISECQIPDDAMLKLKFLGKNPNLEQKIDAEMVKVFIYMMENGTVLVNIPTPMDYRFLDTYEALASELQRNGGKETPKRQIMSETSYKLQNQGTFSTRTLQRIIDNFFSHKEGMMFSNVQETTDTNALSVAEQNSKIYFESFKPGTGGGYYKQRLDPTYFVGLIDPVFTADSADVNIKNELSKDAVIRDGEMFIKLFDKHFKEVEVPAYDYLMSATLACDNVDYLKKTIFPINGKYTVYQFGEYKEITDPSLIDYIRKEDGTLTETTAMIPFVNKTLSMRSMLGAHMLTQALPVEGAQPDVIYTGHGSTVFNETALNEETPIDGKVTVITDEFIKVEKKNEKPVIIRKPQPYNTSNHTTNFFEPCVKVGDKVKAGQTVYSCNSFKNKELVLGVPLFTAFTSWHAREHEDAVVISESAAEKMNVKLMERVKIPMLSTESWILGKDVFELIDNVEISPEKFDEYGIIKPGTQVRRGDPLFVFRKVLDAKKSERARISLALDKNTIPTEIEVVDTPFIVNDGFVSNVSFTPVKNYKGKGLINIEEGDSALKQNKKAFMSLTRHFVSENLNFRAKESRDLGVPIEELKDYKVREGIFQDENQIGELVIDIVYLNKLKVTDKVTNMFGGKGVVSTLVPDEQMFITEDGRRVEIVMSPLAVISRVNISQLYMANLGLISKELYNRLEAFFTKGGDKKEEELLKSCIKDVLYETPDKPLEEVWNENKGYGFVRIRAAAMDRHFTHELITDLLLRLGIHDHVKIYDPMTQKWIQRPIRVGYQNFYRLHFIAENKMKTTGTMRSLGIKGYGATKKEGQSLGEQESHALLAYGRGDMLQKFSYEKQDKASRFFQEALSVGLLLRDVRPDRTKEIGEDN